MDDTRFASKRSRATCVLNSRVILKTDPNKATKVVQYFRRNKKFLLYFTVTDIRKKISAGSFCCYRKESNYCPFELTFLKLLSEKELPAIVAILDFLIFKEIQKIQQSYLKRSEKRINRTRFVK